MVQPEELVELGVGDAVAHGTGKHGGMVDIEHRAMKPAPIVCLVAAISLRRQSKGTNQ